MADHRPSLGGRDDSYNRVTLSKDLKSQIYGMISDSSESLPLASVAESEESLPSTVDKTESAPGATIAGTSSKLSESMAASDMPTPTPEKPNPLEQVETVRETSPRRMASIGEGKDGEEEGDGDVDPVLATPSPVRSHEFVGTHTKALAPRISQMVDTDSDTDADIGEKEPIGTTASRATTASQTPSNASGRKDGKEGRPGMANRQSTMKRISSALKRTVSKNQ